MQKRVLVRKSREELKRELQKIGFKVYPSQANFLLAEIDSSEMLPAESIYTFGSVAFWSFLGVRGRPRFYGLHSQIAILNTVFRSREKVKNRIEVYRWHESELFFIFHETR